MACIISKNKIKCSRGSPAFLSKIKLKSGIECFCTFSKNDYGQCKEDSIIDVYCPGKEKGYDKKQFIKRFTEFISEV